MTRGDRGIADLPPGPARNLADLLRRLRQGHGLSVGQIAAQAGVSRSHVSEVLRGWKTSSPDVAAALARALGAGQEDIGKVRQWAEQARDLQSYQRAHGRPAQDGAGAGVAPITSPRDAAAKTPDLAGADRGLPDGPVPRQLPSAVAALPAGPRNWRH